MKRIFLFTEIQLGIIKVPLFVLLIKKLALPGYLGYATSETELNFLVSVIGTTFGYIFSCSSVRNMYHFHGTISSRVYITDSTKLNH